MTRKNFIFILLSFGLSVFSLRGQQIANYVKNGGFEEYWTCSLPNHFNLAKSWRTIDSIPNGSSYFSTCSAINNIPSNGFTYQLPKSGNAYVGFTAFCMNGFCNSTFNRNYLRTRLKTNLQNGKTYCIKFYYNLSDNSTYGIDGLGIYFGNNYTLDTITKPNIPLTYLIPQLQNANNNMLTDTMNWILFTGTFVASGIENNLVIGNFKSNAATNSVLTNPTYSPTIESDYLIDEVSCIPLDLPAYAGPDAFCIPGNSVYIGRQQDVGIDEACMWYKLPNMTTAIDTAAGIWVTPTMPTTTYIVKQDICGVIKYDTVIVNHSGVGFMDLQIYSDNINLSPNPTSDNLNISFTSGVSQVSISNSLGQIIRKQDLDPKNNQIIFQTSELSNGLYQIHFKTSFGTVTKKFVKTN